MYNDTEFTAMAGDLFYEALESARFKDSPPDEIFDYLKSKIKNVPFCDFLKRIIYLKGNFTGPFNNIDAEECRKYLMEAFRETGTPVSFSASSVKLSTAAKNWLNAVIVSRETVFLIGFALGLNSAEVSDLLSKGLHESKIYYKNPFETICAYCFDHRLSFDKMNQLYDEYLAKSKIFTDDESESNTTFIGSKISTAPDEDTLREIMMKYHLNPLDISSHTARKMFDKLYNECSEIISLEYGATQSNNTADTSLSAGMVTAAEIEKELNTGTPIDKNGNLTKFSDSALCEVFRKKRLSRKRINDIVNNVVSVDRFDLITMNFFINAQRDADKSNNTRWWNFVEETNEILEKCSMGQIYNANPYDVFLQMCLLTDVPMATYDDILEMSYID